jgi:predicted type IV restriction endonuclease
LGEFWRAEGAPASRAKIGELSGEDCGGPAAREQAAVAEKTEQEQKQILAQTNQAADVLAFDEATTRKVLIDTMLAQAGWDVNDPDAVGIEVTVTLADGSQGRADYVLFGDKGEPLAVVEAKRTSIEAEQGRLQAQTYAEAFERAEGVRPIVFYTNGYDLHIWDDAKSGIPRRFYGFYNKESLQRCRWETANAAKLATVMPEPRLELRAYQTEAVRRVCEAFSANRRKALIVQATGTGKTRVAVALAEMLIRAGWVKRVLFLCDRRELRRQAGNAFAEHLDSEPRVNVTAKTAEDRNKSIYLATYPAMSKCYRSFDVGFFDLIIADESHRSIYNRYRELFLYFDAGLAAPDPDDPDFPKPLEIWDCPSRKYRSQWEKVWPAIIIGYSYYGGMDRWSNDRHSNVPSRSPITMAASEPDWVLMTDSTIKIDGAWGSGRATAYEGIPGHTNPGEFWPAGHNQVYVDGSADWVPLFNMYYIHTWNTSGARIAYFWQDDLGELDPASLSKAMP